MPLNCVSSHGMFMSFLWKIYTRVAGDYLTPCNLGFLKKLSKLKSLHKNVEIPVFFISSLMMEHLDMKFDENELRKEQGSSITRETRHTHRVLTHL